MFGTCRCPRSGLLLRMCDYHRSSALSVAQRGHIGWVSVRHQMLPRRLATVLLLAYVAGDLVFTSDSCVSNLSDERSAIVSAPIRGFYTRSRISFRPKDYHPF